MKKRWIAVSLVLVLVFLAGSAEMVLADTSIDTENVSVIGSDPYEYGTAPDGLYVFLYHGHAPYLDMEINTSGCVEDHLYVYDEDTDSVTEICNAPVALYTATKDALYYATATHQIYMTDYSGSNHELLYQYNGKNIDRLSSYWRMLYFVEDNTNVVFFDTTTGIAATMFSLEGVDWVFLLSETELLAATLGEDYYVYNITTRETDEISGTEANWRMNQAVLQYKDTQEADVSLMAVYSPTSVTQANDVSFPLDEYDANIYPSGTASDYTYLKPISWFHNNGMEGCSSSNCAEYTGTHECEGFARYAHDAYMHILDENDEIGYSEWLQIKHPGGRHEFDNDEDIIKSFFATLHTGAYIRYGNNDDDTPANGMHSAIFVSADDKGIRVYECNQNYYKNLTTEEIGGHDKSYFGCGVFFHYMTYTNIAARYHYVLHYVNHSFSDNAVCSSLSYHKVNCTDCNGYLLQNHTGDAAYTILSRYQHTFSASCCSGSVAYTHTASATRTMTNSSDHTLKYPCCDGTISENHISTVIYTYINPLRHQVTAACCTGTASEAHTQRSYIIYSTTQHQISFRCCNQLIYQNHVFNSAGTCTGCGYVEGGFVVQPGKKPVIEETE